MITNIHKNNMGTVSFDGLFKPQRITQDFIVYPLHSGNATDRIMVQSGKRIGYIKLTTGEVTLSPSRSGGSYQHHLALCQPQGALDAEELFILKAYIFVSAGSKVGTNGIMVTDNSGAMEVMK